MKTNDQIDAIMSAIPESFRTRWCGGERGACACMGCVQIGNRAVIARIITGEEYRGDPEGISEAALQQHREIYAANKLTREEWVSWMQRHPEASSKSETGSGITVFYGKIVERAGGQLRYVSIEE